MSRLSVLLQVFRFWFCGVTGVCLLLCAGTDLCSEESRDPFTFGSRTDTVVPTATVLLGILWDATHPLAMVGQQAVGVGDMIEGWRVVEIRQDGLVVERDERRATIEIGQPIPQP